MTDQTRPYRMQRRAESQEQTRQRIVESAVALHGTLGPSRTSISAVAAHAGVRRSTLYRHFRDEAALFDACAGHWAAANPPPDLGDWLAIESPTSGCASPSTSCTPTTAAPSRCSTTSSATRTCPSSRSASAPSGATSRRRATPHGGPRAARRGAPADAGRHRTRDRVLDLEVARAEQQLGAAEAVNLARALVAAAANA